MIKNNKFSILVSLVILYLSFANAKTFEKAGLFDIPNLDKLVHFGLYFVLTSVLIFEHKKLFKNTRQLLLIALIPFFFGGLIEFLQSELTSTRSAEINDVLANSSGIVMSLYLWLIIKPFYNQSIK